MSFVEKLNKCSRSKTAKISVVVLIVLICLISVFMHLLEGHSSLKLIPNQRGKNFIRYEAHNEKTFQPILAEISKSLEAYNKDKLFHICFKRNNYGYDISSPCVFFKLSRKPDWIPEFYDDSNMPDTMPKDLRERIKYDSANNNTKDLQTIWLTCEGKYPVDVENIGPIDYYPFRGFTGFSYPCTNKDECTEPLVAINFERPHSKFEFESITFTGYGITVMLTLLYGPSAYALKAGVLFTVQCTALALNYNETIEFDLLID